MIRTFPALAMLVLFSTASRAEQLLPRCGPALDGQVSEGGCMCRHDRGGSLTGHGPGWRWSCDLLRGPGATEPVAPADLSGTNPPSVFTYAPQGGGTMPPGSGAQRLSVPRRGDFAY